MKCKIYFTKNDIYFTDYVNCVINCDDNLFCET